MRACPCSSLIPPILLFLIAKAVRLPNTTYLPAIFDPTAIQTIIEGLGMIYQKHEVITEDGYIVNLNRMINPDSPIGGTPVLFVSGLEMHSEAWFTQMSPLSNLPVAWSMEGFDIWLGDARGSIRSRKHVRLSSWDPQFWDFSMHEIGLYDLPAFINYILRATGHPKLVYSGFSNGGAYYYIMCSMKPQYQEVLHGGILLAPAGTLAQFSSMTPMERTAWRSYTLGAKMEWKFGIGALPPLNDIFRGMTYVTCKIASLFMSLPTKLVDWTNGGGCHFDEKNFCVQGLLTFGGTSAKTFLHSAQLLNNGGRFCQFDYGTQENYRRYGQPYPPDYDVSKIYIPTAMYYSDADILVPARVLEPLTRRLQGPTYHCKIKNVCHIFYYFDKRVAPYVEDATQVLLSLTPASSQQGTLPRNRRWTLFADTCHVRMP